MYHLEKELQFTVRVSEPDVRFGSLLPEPNFTSGFIGSDPHQYQIFQQVYGIKENIRK